MSVTWDNVAFNPQPSAYQVTYRFIGNSLRTADGTLRVDFVAEKATIEIRFDWLDTGQWQNIRNLYVAKRNSEKVLTLHDGRSFNVIAAVGGWEESETFLTADGSVRYTVRLRFEEV
jgi:hypothetical protein